jgi:plastocyanin
MKRYRIKLSLVAIFAMSFSPIALAKEHSMPHEIQRISEREIARTPETGKVKAGKTATVTIDGFQFMPDSVVIQKGGKVMFINKDATPHTVTPEPGAKFMGTGRLEKSSSARAVVFTTTGEQNYFCEIHPSMKGKIIVMEKRDILRLSGRI